MDIRGLGVMGGAGKGGFGPARLDREGFGIHLEKICSRGFSPFFEALTVLLKRKR